MCRDNYYHYGVIVDTIMDYIGEQTVSKYPTSAECKAARFGAEGVLYAIEEAPAADVVEVVRCKDCKYYENMQEEDGGGLCKFWLDWLLTEDWFPTEENGFCSNGKRREENG